MRKLMLLAAMLAMVLVAAAPALAQDATAGDDGTATGGDVTETQYDTQIVDCGDVLAFINAVQYGGDAVASGDEAVAEASNEFGVSTEIVNICIVAGEDVNVNAATGEVVAEDGADGDDGAAGAAGAAGADGADGGAATLPDTGGASLFTLGAGALLVGGGLLARRIFR